MRLALALPVCRRPCRAPRQVLTRERDLGQTAGRNKKAACNFPTLYQMRP